MTKILVIFTGGTIGSAAEGKAVNLSGDSKKMLLDMYEEKYGNDVEFSTLSPINILSENVQSADLEKLANCVKEVDKSLYDGIIVTHGTDTLYFTGNYFSQIFCDITIPMVFVSALFPLQDKRSNGLDNFKGAVTFIKKARLSGVWASFKNEGEPIKIHLASRLAYSDQLNGHYHSVLDVHFAEITEDDEVKYITSKHNPTVEQVKNRKCKALESGLCDRVLLITARSLLNFALYDFERIKPQAVVIELYHSDTVCTVGDETNFKSFAAYCKQKEVPLIIAPVDSSANVYGSMMPVPENVIFSYDMTLEMTTVKIMCALHKGLPANAYFDSNNFFEKING